jgi:hypothetical protein
LSVVKLTLDGEHSPTLEIKSLFADFLGVDICEFVVSFKMSDETVEPNEHENQNEI